MRLPLIQYIYCIFDYDTNNYKQTDFIVKAKNSLSAAKKIYRTNKNLVIVNVLEVNTNLLYTYDTSQFFTVKKDFKLKR